ncbi:hypothetical protein B0T19DRAFT_430071 [Cercophora scortea]|uniref:Uncharacterized protein n=1 Tax=Cercophora scortea TaxID=314031 RepID=A0AAE0I9M4_9PEZI|nr:hypothetical protein B0T19DRAFT_430071 [Cercophora scortea]
MMAIGSEAVSSWSGRTYVDGEMENDIIPHHPRRLTAQEEAALEETSRESSTSTSTTQSTSTTTSTSIQSSSATVPFTNVRDLFDVIDCTTTDFLSVTDVSPSSLAEIEAEREKKQRKFRFRRYDSSSRILLVTIPTEVHEELHVSIYQLYMQKIASMGLRDSWRTTASGRCQSQAHFGQSSKEGDSTGGPEPERGAPTFWPTLAIEAGASESLGELRHDMRWWFSASNHEVKVVVLAQFDPTRSAIVIERWEEEPAEVRSVATKPQSCAVLGLPSITPSPILRQSITITQNTATNPVSYNVAGGPLALPFRLLFLREPRLTESDVIISVENLESYAAKVWKRAGN